MTNGRPVLSEIDIEDRFGDASDFTFYITGAVPPERMKPLVEQYVASLPSTNRTVREQPKDPKVKPLVEIIRYSRPVYAVPKTSTMLVFDTRLSSDPKFGADSAELRTVAAIQRRTLELQLQTNAYWMATMQQYDRLGIPIDRIPDPYNGLFTPEQVRTAAQRYTPTSAFVQLADLPADSAVTDSSAMAWQEQARKVEAFRDVHGVSESPILFLRPIVEPYEQPIRPRSDNPSDLQINRTLKRSGYVRPITQMQRGNRNLFTRPNSAVH
jgi:hypothetical protein